MRDLRAAAILLGILLACAPARALDVESEYRKAASTIMCDCGCHPQSTLDCACSKAERMRGEIHAAVAGGKSGDQVIADYVAQKGEGARIIPTTEGFNLLAWLGPGFGFLTAAGFVVLLLRRWKRRQPPQSRTPATVLATDDPYAARLEREMRDFE